MRKRQMRGTEVQPIEKVRMSQQSPGKGRAGKGRGISNTFLHISYTV